MAAPSIDHWPERILAKQPLSLSSLIGTNGILLQRSSCPQAWLSCAATNICPEGRGAALRRLATPVLREDILQAVANAANTFQHQEGHTNVLVGSHAKIGHLLLCSSRLLEAQDLEREWAKTNLPTTCAEHNIRKRLHAWIYQTLAVHVAVDRNCWQDCVAQQEAQPERPKHTSKTHCLTWPQRDCFMFVCVIKTIENKLLLFRNLAAKTQWDLDVRPIQRPSCDIRRTIWSETCAVRSNDDLQHDLRNLSWWVLHANIIDRHTWKDNALVLLESF